MTNEINSYYEGARLSEAAYANFTVALQQTNDDAKKAKIIAALMNPKTCKMTESQAADFVANYDVVSHEPNDPATGFSATLLKNKKTEEYTLSFRGTEVESDTWNDLFLSDGQIATFGCARDQIISMYNYYQELSAKKNGNNVVEYINYQLSAYDTPPGANDIPGLEIEENGKTVYTYHKHKTITVSKEGILANIELNVAGHSLGGHLAMAFSRLFSDNTDECLTYNAPGFKNFEKEDFNTKALFNKLNGGANCLFPANKITHLYGNTGTSNLLRLEWIAGIHNLYENPSVFGNAYKIFIEDTPGDSSNHSQSLLTDSLALQDLLVSKFGAEDKIFTTGGVLDAIGGEESTKLERMLDSVRKIVFQNQNLPLTTDRDSFYSNIDFLASEELPDGAKFINLTEKNAVYLQDKALNSYNSLAYKYALAKQGCISLKKIIHHRLCFFKHCFVSD